MTWTLFWDMNSGGGQKEPYSHIYIEAPEDQAEVIFYNRFDHNPSRVTCTCCGEDYSIYGKESLEELTDFHRRGRFGSDERISLEEYIQQSDVLVIHSDEISDDERRGDVPDQGYVWAG